jgi:HSP20 family molecular chaperone IbpA
MHASIDETIARVEQLYMTLTGRRPPPSDGHAAPIPPESDPLVHVEEQLARLMTSIEQLAPVTSRPWIPRAIVWRDDSGIAIAIDVPRVPREHVSARLDDGVLTIRIANSSRSEPSQIPIRS